jgi:hypothetical protein
MILKHYLLAGALCAVAALCALTAVAPVAPAGAATKHKAKAKPKPKKPKPKATPRYRITFEQTRVIERINTCPNHGGETVSTGTETLETKESGFSDGLLNKTEGLKLDSKSEVVSGEDPSAEPIDIPGTMMPMDFKVPAEQDFKISRDGKTATFTYPGVNAKPDTLVVTLPKVGPRNKVRKLTDSTWVTGTLARGDQGCMYHEQGQTLGTFTVERVR